MATESKAAATAIGRTAIRRGLYGEQHRCKRATGNPDDICSGGAIPRAT